MYDYDPASHTIYFADSDSHCIKALSEETGESKVVAGKLDEAGYRDGDKFNSRFNNPFNVKFYSPDLKAIIKAYNMKTVIIDISSPFCRDNQDSLTRHNYQQCLLKDTSNLIYSRSSVKQIQMRSNQEIEQEVANVINNGTVQQHLFFNENVLFVADKGNSCVRIIYLKQGITKTWAGVCLQSGFMDGPLLYNRFQSPESLGTDVYGNVMVYDSTSKYTRFVDANDTMVYTLVNGACRLDQPQPNNPVSIKQLHINTVTCYKNWIKTGGQPISHIYQNPYANNVCYKHSIECIIKKEGRQVEIINFE